MKPRHCGPFVPNPDVPPDHRGHQACRHCGLMGESGDAHHPVPEPPEDDARMRAAGEREG